jgi:hypothetical protein
VGRAPPGAPRAAQLRPLAAACAAQRLALVGRRGRLILGVWWAAGLILGLIRWRSCRSGSGRTAANPQARTVADRPGRRFAHLESERRATDRGFKSLRFRKLDQRVCRERHVSSARHTRLSSQFPSQLSRLDGRGERVASVVIVGGSRLLRVVAQHAPTAILSISSTSATARSVLGGCAVISNRSMFRSWQRQRVPGRCGSVPGSRSWCRRSPGPRPPMAAGIARRPGPAGGCTGSPARRHAQP